MGVIGGVNPHRVGMPAGVGVGLIDDDVVLAVEQMGSGQARDSRTDDCDPHSSLSFPRRSFTGPVRLFTRCGPAWITTRAPLRTGAGEDCGPPASNRAPMKRLAA